MQRLTSLVSQRSFAQNTLTGQLNPDRNHSLRVMSTPQWPVPYYQRAFRHDPAPLHDNDMTLSNFNMPIHDVHSLLAKEILKTQGKGYIVEMVENHFDIKNFQTKFEDSSEFAAAYVDDMIECLDLVAR